MLVLCIFLLTDGFKSLSTFQVCELGNFSIHWALRNLRPPGSKERRIPQPTKDPLTLLFKLVSCPNYTYEVGGWIAFTVMAQCLPGLFFVICQVYYFSVVVD